MIARGCQVQGGEARPWARPEGVGAVFYEELKEFWSWTWRASWHEHEQRSEVVAVGEVGAPEGGVGVGPLGQRGRYRRQVDLLGGAECV